MIDITKDDLLNALEKCDYKILTTAKFFSVSRDKIRNLLKKYGIHVETKLGVRKKYKYNNDKVNNIYNKMIARCTNPARADFTYYGARGIKVWDEWLSDRDSFYEYIIALDNFGVEGYSLDRIDNNGDYAPGNLRFASKSEQANNTRRNRLVEYNGEVLTLMNFYNKYGKPLGFSYTLLLDRFKLGFTPEEALALPKQMKRKYFFKEESSS